jgi:triacylglycerol lipase
MIRRWQIISEGLILFNQSFWPCAASAERADAGKQDGDYVVLLHGLGRTALSMKRLEWTLDKEGFRVVNESYPSTRLSVEEAANGWLTDLLDKRTPDRGAKINFVTHSLGGIVLRQYLQNHRVENLGRVVMLAPPNQGSELVDKLRRNLLFKLFTGPAGQELGTDTRSLPKRLGPPAFELGIIAGDRSFNPWFSVWIPRPNDGKVSVQSTLIEGMKDFRVTHQTHTWMPWSKEVGAVMAQFLKPGHFSS